jgi:hypothetical protein
VIAKIFYNVVAIKPSPFRLTKTWPLPYLLHEDGNSSLRVKTQFHSKESGKDIYNNGCDHRYQKWHKPTTG